MKTQIPRFLLGSPQGWKTFDASSDCVILPGFSSYDAAADFCQTDGTGIWELQRLGCERVRERLEAACPQTLKLIAVNPAHAGELSLRAITLETVCHALRNAGGTIDPEYRLMRDHWGSPWNHARIAVTPPRIAKAEAWYVSCLHPQNMKFVGGQPPWFWLDWFDGKHFLTELQTERGGSTEREFFIFPSRASAEGFYGATVARLLGCICDCQIDSHLGSEFEAAMWEKDHDVCNRTSATIGKRLW
jgi:hypothetical protein